MGAVKIGGNIQGGSGQYSGEIVRSSTLAGLTLGGSLLGGSGLHSGEISSVGPWGR
jgi:hypothetical protein